MLTKQHDVIPVTDEEETLILEEINFAKRFVPQQELSAEQAFWLQPLNPNTEQSDTSPVKIEAPRELPKTLKDIFNVFDKDLLDEITEVQTVFNQMEVAVQQYSINKQCFKIHKKELFLNNDRLLHQIMSQDIMFTVMNSTAVFGDYINLEMKKCETCNKCLDLEVELDKRKNMVERDVYTELSKSFSKLEKHCNSLELAVQLNQQNFQKDKSCENQNASEFLLYFENNDMKAHLQEKDTTINKLRNHIKSLRETDQKDKVKQDMNEIETINIELKHIVAKLLSENVLLRKEIEHLKNIHKDQFDSIKKTCACSKEHSDSLIAQLNCKSIENADLKGQIQENIFGTTILQNELWRLKDVNVRSTSKYAKNNKKQNFWKPTGKVFTDIGYRIKGFLTPRNPNQVTGNPNASNVPSSSSLVDLRYYKIQQRSDSKDYELWRLSAGKRYNHSGLLCGRVSDDLGKLQLKAVIEIFIGYAPAKKEFRIYNKKTRMIIETIHEDFDELTAMASEQFSAGTLNALRDNAADPTGSPVSTSIDQDAPSSSNPSTQAQEQSPIISQGVKESPKTPHFHGDPLHETLHEDSTS
ncbi:hypothetical protein Tco_1271201 [Tanacetum coccineum]